MRASPAGVIRQYLEEHDGQTEVPLHNLLTTWEIDSADQGEREQITADLRAEGVNVEPGLNDLGEDDQVLLTIDEGESEPAGAVGAPPWQEDLRAPTEETAPVESASPPSGGGSGRDETAAQGQQVERQPEPGPGWFPNEHGPGQRYWDGAKWTNSYRDDPPKRKRQWFAGSRARMAIAFAVVVLLLLGALALATSGGSKYEAGCRQDLENTGYTGHDLDAHVKACVKVCEATNLCN